MKKFILYIFFISVAFILGCQEEYELNQDPPATGDADIVITEDPAKTNTFIFGNNSDAFMKVWQYSTGQTGKGNADTLYIPFKGDYTAKLTIYNAGGSVSFEKSFTVEQTDETICSNEVLTLLTGGCDAQNGKTWVIDSTTAGHFGLGPRDANGPIWYAAGAQEKKGGGMYDDRYTFFLANYKYQMQTNGQVYINGGQRSQFPGSYSSPVGDFTAPFQDPQNLTYVLEEGDGNPMLTISSGGFMGYYTGVRTYEILELSEDVMFLKYYDNVNDFSWYVRYIREGYEPGGGGGPVEATLPIDFETVEPAFAVFGNSAYAIVDNPHSGGINTSDRVLETVHGDQTWAGLNVDLAEPLDFSPATRFSVKVYAPQTGVFKLKFENIDNTQDNMEIDQDVTVANEWTELTFDVSAVPSGKYARVVLFPGWNVPNAGTFYIDDLRIYQEINLPLTFENFDPQFTVFGNSAYSIVDNPHSGGINTSARVLETVHGDQAWAGLFVDLAEPLTFGSSSVFKIKVYAPQTGVFKLKFENIANDQDVMEIDRDVTAANEWVELSFDVSAVPSGRFARIVIFPGWNVANAGTFYLDDFILE